MNPEEIRAYCLSKPGATEDMPFDDCVLTFRVANKVFALMNICKVESINLKYPSQEIDELRASEAGVYPGYHMSKKHWNTIRFEEANLDRLIQWIDISYQLVFEGLTKKAKQALLENN